MEEQKENKIMVSIISLAYNHASYIRECLDGFMMQKTNFAFEVLIHDDASTDGTADIIREYEAKYPDIIKPIYQTENQYSKGIPIGCTYLYPRAKGKYIALCEGDDYWTDPFKLQKQVDFLESHPDYVMCCHSFDELNLINQEKWEPPRISERITIDDLIHGRCCIRTLTIMFNRLVLLESKYMNNKSKIDISLYFSLLSKGVGFYMADTMAIYRKNNGGVWSKLNTSQKWEMSFLNKYHILECENNKLSATYMYHFLKQEYSRKIQLFYGLKIVKSLFKIGQYLGLIRALEILGVILFRYRIKE